jgi:hypothetical protein
MLKPVYGEVVNVLPTPMEDDPRHALMPSARAPKRRTIPSSWTLAASTQHRAFGKCISNIAFHFVTMCRTD